MIYLLNRVREFKRQAVHSRGHAHITCSLHEFSHISRLSDRKLPDQSHVDFDFRARRNCARAGIVDWNGKQTAESLPDLFYLLGAASNDSEFDTNVLGEPDDLSFKSSPRVQEASCSLARSCSHYM